MRIALVGLGAAARELHVPALEGIASAELVAGCDADPSRREEAERLWGIRAFEDFEALLGEVRPDVVVVATPPDSHAEFCVRSLRAGAHVFCEKPFVSSLEEADRVIETARASGRGVALNHEFRELPIFRAVREQVGRPGVGELAFVQLWQLIHLPPEKEPGWRAALRRRTLYEAGVHLVDFAMCLFGEKPVAISATISSGGVPGAQMDAVTLVTLEFAGGRVAHVLQDRLCRGETQYFEVRADAAEASLRASFGGRARLSAGLFRSTRPHLRFEYGQSGIAWLERGAERESLARNPARPRVVATRRLLSLSLDSFRDGRAPPVTASHARDVLEVIAAGYRSAEEGRRLRLDELPEDLARLRMGAV